MARATSGAVVRQIESLFEGGSVAGLTDRLLLERFAARRDLAGEEAFAALVTRHGPMVLDTCRQILGDPHHAEDAFQAVFLVLARKARSIREPDLLSYWLHGVALRTARKAKVWLVRQRKNEEGGSMRRPGLDSGSRMTLEPMAQPLEQLILAREQAEALHSEIDRLPRPFRLPVVLCYFEGLTLDEAARRLRWRPGTLRSRLARARDKLRRGLTRRGYRPVNHSTGHGPKYEVRPGFHHDTSAHSHDEGRHPLRDQPCCSRYRLDCGDGFSPGGSPIHASLQAEIHRADLARRRCRRDGCGIFEPLTGDDEARAREALNRSASTAQGKS